MYGMFTEAIPMTEKHKGIIRDNWEELTTNLAPDGMLNKLVAEDIISFQEQEELLAEQPASHKRARALLALLVKRPDKAFYVLIEACGKYNMPHLAKLLKDAGRPRVDVKNNTSAIIKANSQSTINQHVLKMLKKSTHTIVSEGKGHASWQIYRWCHCEIL